MLNLVKYVIQGKLSVIDAVLAAEMLTGKKQLSIIMACKLTRCKYGR